MTTIMRLLCAYMRGRGAPLPMPEKCPECGAPTEIEQYSGTTICTTEPSHFSPPRGGGAYGPSGRTSGTALNKFIDGFN